MPNSLPQDLQLHLDSFNYVKAEEALDRLLSSDMENSELLFTRSIVAMGQYSFGSTRVKEGLAYLNRSIGYSAEIEYFRPHILHIGQNAKYQLQSFITGTSDEAKKSSVGTVTDPAWKMVTDTAITNMKVDAQSDHILEVIDYLIKLVEFFPGTDVSSMVNEYTAYAARNGTDLGKKINSKRAHHGYTEQSTSSCFVATAIYGSPEDQRVLILRRFRDEKLVQSVAGRLFSRIYYQFGPIAARGVVRNQTAHKTAKAIIDYLVKVVRSSLEKR
ncbi:MAG: hypothetical protein O3A57_11395 [Bacteroidetes bacterium]|nr:hypothetical protein [Bacteroidota bacterium]